MVGRSFLDNRYVFDTVLAESEPRFVALLFGFDDGKDVGGRIFRLRISLHIGVIQAWYSIRSMWDHCRILSFVKQLVFAGVALLGHLPRVYAFIYVLGVYICHSYDGRTV
jgi:hypothetical protein